MTDIPQHKPALRDMIDFLTERRDAAEKDTDDWNTFDAQISAAELADIIVDTFGELPEISDQTIRLAVANPQCAHMVVRALAAALKFYEMSQLDAQKRLSSMDEATLALLLEKAK